ncbi:MAG: hypothetical protein IPJ82_16490 [Lewinellaceae bacterium]|nr:hypothetical protein [Lewinellaceae bacterium]
MKNALSRIIFLCLMAGAGLLPAQQELEFTNGCNFASDKTAGKYTLFEPTEEAEKIVDEILNLSGITGDRPFTLQVATVDNAQANERKGVRYLLYSNKFMGDFKVEGKTKWAAYFVFAHEIGHLVRGHNFSETDVKARKKMELEADRFAAVAMARMRASRNDALAAAQNLKARINIKPEYYPDPAAREEAISIEYDKEWKKILDAEKGKVGGDKIFIAIDPASFNRWNLISSASAELTDEKVLVRFKIMPQYNGRTVNVILCSFNPKHPGQHNRRDGHLHGNTRRQTCGMELPNGQRAQSDGLTTQPAPDLCVRRQQPAESAGQSRNQEKMLDSGRRRRRSRPAGYLALYRCTCQT